MIGIWDMFKIKPLAYGLGLGIIDTILLATTKSISIGQLSFMPYMMIVMILYGIQPWIFYNSLAGESMSIMNLLWDVMSNIMVSVIGIWYFKENISNMKYIGIILSVISLTILSYEDN